MQIFLSALETGGITPYQIVARGAPLIWCLMSYYYLTDDMLKAEFVRDNCQQLLIDSGAHSFQRGKKVDWVDYTRRYAAFIRRFDRPNVLGYFEMDVDNVVGVPNVLALRRILADATDKVIPVWHYNRGLDDFLRMCDRYAGRIVAVTGFQNYDIADDDYAMFLKAAHERGCRLHCLGLTRTDIMDRVPFDYTDSSSWKLGALFGKVCGRQVTRACTRERMEDCLFANYREAVAMQRHYHDKWRGVAPPVGSKFPVPSS